MEKITALFQVGIFCALLACANVAGAAGYADGTLDISFGFGTTLNQNSPAVNSSTSYGKILTTDVLGNTVAAGVGNFGWAATATKVVLSGVSLGVSASSGFYHNGSFGSTNGLVEWESNTSIQTFGDTPLPGAGKNTANFDSIYSSGDLGQDVTGVLGFLSSNGNWGYLEFDWEDASSTLTVLSAKIQRFTGQPITFTPSPSASAVVPEPSSLLLLTVALAMRGRRRIRRHVK